jgi:hypothetical protein
LRRKPSAKIREFESHVKFSKFSDQPVTVFK